MITLASDFGSPYPAAMRGVLARRTDARVVDVTHDLPRQDVRGAAFWLRFVLPEFPPAVHCAVVDPGVGTDRDAVVVRAGDHLLVGPDNGSLLPPARALAGDDDDPEVFEWRVEDPASSTFHGRDVFAPAAAAVHEGAPPGTGEIAENLLALDQVARTDEFVDLSLPEPTVRESGADGEVLVVDDFGNAITNVPGTALPAPPVEGGPDSVVVDGERVTLAPTFAGVDPGERLVTVGSHGYLECDVNRGRGDEAFDLEPGASVTFRWGTSG